MKSMRREARPESGAGQRSTLVRAADGLPALATIRVLGHFSFDFPGTPVDPALWRRAHARRLLQMLGSAPRMTEPRVKVLSALWPGFDEQRARNRLHHTVHWIRHGLEVVPATSRPQIIVGSDKVELVLAGRTAVDAQEFLHAFEEDSSDDASRLAAVERAIACYDAELAPDWQGVAEIDSRRTWLADLFDRALGEGVQLATDLEHDDLALQLAQSRAMRPGADVEAHCLYASLLVDQGRADAAVLHCRAVRDLLAEEDPDSVRRIDDMVRDIQQHANRAQHVRENGSAPAPRAAAAVPGRAPALLPRRKPLLGYERQIDATLRVLSDHYTSVVTLVGAPGCGKSAIATEVCHRKAADYRHGAVWVDCADASSTLVQAMCHALSVAADVGSTAEAVSQALHGREMLLILDGVRSDDAPTVSAWADANRDLRWLATSRAPLRLRGEKCVGVEPSELLGTGDGTLALPAAQIIAAASTHTWSLQDKRLRATVEAIARSVDGLPCLLEAASDILQTVWPNELLSRLDRDGSTLFRVPAAAGIERARYLDELVDWIRGAPAGLKRLLSIAGGCRSWLSREDLAALWDSTDDEIQGLIELAVRNHYMIRHVRQVTDGAWSEFRVPRYVSAALVVEGSGLAQGESGACIELWLSTLPVHGGLPTDSARLSSWFDDHFEDFESLVLKWQIIGRHAELAALCMRLMPLWRESVHAGRVAGWLTSLGENLEQVPGAEAAQLLLERARLRALHGYLHGAFEDAGRALARLGELGSADLRADALRMIERYGADVGDARRSRTSVNEKGIEAGESLLQVAQIAFQQDDLAKALQLCGEAIGVFNYFGLTRGLLKAQQLRAKLAFAIGDLHLAGQCVAHAERAARVVGDPIESASAELMRASLMLAEQQFAKALELISALMSRPELSGQAQIESRGLLLLGWSHYATGAYPVARVFSSALREQAKLTAHTGTRISVETLSALLDLRGGGRATAMRRISDLVDLLSNQRYVHDVQTECINAAELSFLLDRFDLANKALAKLTEFAQTPEHRLRPWVAERARMLRSKMPDEVHVGAVDLRRAPVAGSDIVELLSALSRA